MCVPCLHDRNCECVLWASMCDGARFDHICWIYAQRNDLLVASRALIGMLCNVVLLRLLPRHETYTNMYVCIHVCWEYVLWCLCVCVCEVNRVVYSWDDYFLRGPFYSALSKPIKTICLLDSRCALNKHESIRHTPRSHVIWPDLKKIYIKCTPTMSCPFPHSYMIHIGNWESIRESRFLRPFWCKIAKLVLI